MIIPPRHSPKTAGRQTETTAPAPTSGYKLLAVSILLLAVTWVPLMGLHVHRMSLGATSTGAMIVVFAPTFRSDELFQQVIAADGSLVRPIGWFRNAWVVQSLEPGFAGRLKERGAWGVYSLDLLSASALFNCLRSPISSAPASPTAGTASFSAR